MKNYNEVIMMWRMRWLNSSVATNNAMLQDIKTIVVKIMVF